MIEPSLFVAPHVFLACMKMQTSPVLGAADLKRGKSQQRVLMTARWKHCVG
jgi:hypothetical protein